GHLLEPQLERVGDADDLQDPPLDEAVRASPDGGLRHAKLRGDLGERPAAVLLKGLDDSLVEIADLVAGAARWSWPRRGHGALLAGAADGAGDGGAGVSAGGAVFVAMGAIERC